jgi:peroxiredoxin
MPNDLTGDFDVVAQFSIPAVNRILAAMHRFERFAHSMAIRIDDIEQPPGGVRPSVEGVLDSFGGAAADHRRPRRANGSERPPVTRDAAFFGFGPVVNFPTAVLEIPPVVPSNLQGFAQLQLFPPTIEINDAAGKTVTVRIHVIARYFPDRDTSPMAEFVRGHLTITAPVSQVASQAGSVIEIDITSANLGVGFAVDWSSRPLSPSDIAAIKLLIRNALKTSFLPSNSTLPSNVSHMQFKTMRAGGKAVAVLMDLDGGPSNPNSADKIILGSGDDFTVGVSSDFVEKAFQPTIDKFLSDGVDPVSFDINGLVHTWHITYTFTLNTADIQLRDDEIVLTITGRARTSSWPPNFDFTVVQRFSLAPTGATARLVIGDISIDTSSWIIDRFRGLAIDTMRRSRNRALARGGTRRAVRDMLSADRTLGGFLNSLLVPPSPTSAPPGKLELAYTAVEVSESGIILRGALGLDAWPPVHAEYEQVPSSNTSPVVAGISGPTFSALNSWIPGGTILSYEWKQFGQSSPGFIEENKFIFQKSSPGLSTESIASLAPGLQPVMIEATPVTGYKPFCVTVRGTRLSRSGPTVMQPVSSTFCTVGAFPLLDAKFEGHSPMVALTTRAADGGVRVEGHAAAARATPGRPGPNLLVHFGDSSSARSLELLVQSLRDSGRIDAPTAIVAVLPSTSVPRAAWVERVTYATDEDNLWSRRFGVDSDKRPLALIVAPSGEVVWKQEGSLDAAELTAALRKYLVAGKGVVATLEPAAVRIGHRPPNFLFQHAPGRGLTLRKVAGKPARLVFWRRSSPESIEAVRAAMRPSANAEFVVLAINDGDALEVANRVADENKFGAILVTDPERSISTAYGITVWPTIVSIDADGVVRGIRQGAADDVSEEYAHGADSGGSLL